MSLVSHMDVATLEALLIDGESQLSERKRSLSDEDRIGQVICAFANDLPNYGEPGVIYVGVNDDGSCAEIDVSDQLLQRLSAFRDDGRLTPFPSMDVRKVELCGCTCAVVIVHPSANPPVRYRGRVWIRVGPRRAVASEDEERRLVEKRRWRLLPYDAQPVDGSGLDDLDLRRFHLEYLPSFVSPDAIERDNRQDSDRLLSLRLVAPDLTPTTTALLMLGKSTQDWLPGASIQWRAIDGTKLTDPTLDEHNLTGTVPDQLRRIDELVDTAITRSIGMGRSVHVAEETYPLSALQQIIRNAVMHRTYEMTTTPVRVTWYSDRFEILSPGGPFGAVSSGAFGTPGLTDYRNPTLAEALKAYGYVERFGQGMEMIRESLAQNGNPPAEYRLMPEESPAWVHVTVWARQ